MWSEPKPVRAFMIPASLEAAVAANRFRSLVQQRIP
jgi:hypothetical protein